MNSKQVFEIGARPLPAYIGGLYTANTGRGRHEASFWSDVPARYADRPSGIRSSHSRFPSGAVPVDSLQRGAGNVVWFSAATPPCGSQKPRTDVVCAAGICAVHAASGQRRDVRFSASNCNSSRSTRSSWLSGGLTPFCSSIHPTGSISGSTMGHLRGGLWLAGLGFDVRDADSAAINRREKINQRLNGLNAWIDAVTCGDLSRQRLGASRHLGDVFPVLGRDSPKPIHEGRKN